MDAARALVHGKPPPSRAACGLPIDRDGPEG